MSKETKIIFDELNFSIARITEREKKWRKLKENEYWYKEELKRAGDIVLKLDKGKKK
jgi:hypothetical protein